MRATVLFSHLTMASESKDSTKSKATGVLADAPESACIDPVEGATKHATLASYYELNTAVSDGRKLRHPALGLGVYQSRNGPETENAVLAALKKGYRLVDTARIYGNEESVGSALKKSGVPREQVFVTTKLWNSDHGYDSTIKACNASLKRLGLDYIDLYLIHWPVPEKRKDTWRAFETLQAEGKVRSIGVSNYMVKHLEELLAHAKVKPSVNQIELSPYTTRDDVVAFCKKNDILVEAYSPLTQGAKFNDEKLKKLANKYKVTPAQLLLRWGLQDGAAILPKSVNDARIAENANIFGFHISDDDMKLMKTFNESFAQGWDPTNAP